MNRTLMSYSELSSKDKDVINFDPAIVSISRLNNNQQLQYNGSGYHLSDDASIDDQQQINVIDQMIAQPHIPYVLLPKHFKPQLISVNRNPQRHDYLKNNDQEHEPIIHRSSVITNSFYKPHKKNYHNSYSYQSPSNYTHARQFLNSGQQQQHRGGSIRDDHRIKTSIQQLFIDKGASDNILSDKNY